jgi:hypothetical protein
MKTIDGRDFLYNFVLDSCGVDFAIGIPSGVRGEYENGVRKPAIDLFNLLIYNCHEDFNLMLDEQRRRRESNG